MTQSGASFVGGNWYATSDAPAPSAMLRYVDATGATNFLTFDVVVSEDWDAPATVTEHPVEGSANVSDHVHVELTKCDLKVFASNEPIFESMTLGSYSDQPSRGPLTLVVPTISWTAQPLTLVVPTWDNPIELRALAMSAAGAIGGIAGGATGGAIGAIGGGLLASLAFAAHEKDVTQGTDAGLQPHDGNVIPPTVQVDQWPGTTDYVAAMHALLVQLKNAAQQFTVLGTKQQLFPMVIETLSFHRGEDTGSGEAISIGLKEVRIVTTQVVPAPIPNLSAGGGKPPANHGGQDPTPSPESLARILIANGAKAYGQLASLLGGGAT